MPAARSGSRVRYTPKALLRRLRCPKPSEERFWRLSHSDSHLQPAVSSALQPNCPRPRWCTEHDINPKTYYNLQKKVFAADIPVSLLPAGSRYRQLCHGHVFRHAGQDQAAIDPQRYSGHVRCFFRCGKCDGFTDILRGPMRPRGILGPGRSQKSCSATRDGSS